MNSASRIRVLPLHVVNKIAAGEVVERPASVVKELMDNAVDAGAKRIAVTIEDGGRQLIRVTDDGGGMTPEELHLCVLPHATSKIATDEDLYAVSTMGFRGEALASIAAVSKLRIVSRPPGAQEGFEVRVVGERIESSPAAGGATGTTVEVRDLFFNVPARRRFLRAAATEVGHVHEQFARMALAWPGVAFELTNHRRMMHQYSPCAERLDRIAQAYGTELASALMHIQRDERGTAIDAYAAPPAQSRANPQWQYIFVNGRYIRDRFLQHAIKEAYRGLMEPNRYPVIFLFLTIDPHLLDVNVHPTKIEVRWADSNMVHSQVLSALRESFRRFDLSPALRTDRASVALSDEEQDRMRHELAEMLKSTTPIGPFQNPTTGTSHSAPSPFAGSDRSRMPPSGDPTEIWRSLYAPPTPFDSSTPSSPASTIVGSGRFSIPERTRAIQMHNLYLVAETDEGIIIVDQHALHERVMYEELRSRMTSGPLEAQRLLLPETMDVTPEQAALLNEHGELFSTLGIEITPFGRGAIAVHSFPALLKDADVAAFMHDLLDHLAEHATSSTEVIIHELLDMMACKAAVKAGDTLSTEEIEALIRKRDLIDKSSSCPHGRPTVLRLTKADLARQFKRT